MTDYADTTGASYTSTKRCKGFSLIEVITVLTITAMTMIAAIGIYNRVKATAVSINQKLDENALPTEILQRIAEDLDRLATPGSDTTLTIVNKLDISGYNIARLIILNRIYDKNNKPQTFEEIVWQTSYDHFEEALILYRSHGGRNLEDKVITDDIQAERQERGTEFLIPLCSGITYFKIRIPLVKTVGESKKAQEVGAKDETVEEESEKFLEKWTSVKLPKAIAVTISFAEPYLDVTGQLDVPENEKITRTIAIDRTRRIKYRFIKKDFETEDANDIDSSQTPLDEAENEQRDDLEDEEDG
jgi:prepilin-type N-terminal cleavage/methylation domain-containing protein